MAFNFETFNRERLFDIDTSDYEYIRLEGLFEQVELNSDHKFEIQGVYINTKGKFGDSPVVAISDKYLVNMPAHTLEMCKAMLDSPAAIAAINQGKCGFTIEEFYNKRYDKKCYSPRWCNM